MILMEMSSKRVTEELLFPRADTGAIFCFPQQIQWKPVWNFTVFGTSLVVQWLTMNTSTAAGHEFVPWSGNKDPMCQIVRGEKKIT